MAAREYSHNSANKQPAQKIAPRIRFGISVTTTRPATNTQIAESVNKDLSGVWLARPGFTWTDETACARSSNAANLLPEKALDDHLEAVRETVLELDLMGLPEPLFLSGSRIRSAVLFDLGLTLLHVW